MQLCSGCGCNCAWDEQLGGGGANTYRMVMCSCIRARRTTIPKMGCSTTVPRMQMQLCMGCATAWGQGQNLPHGGHICIRAEPTSMPKTAYRHKLGSACRCNCAWDAQPDGGKALGMCNGIGAGQELCQQNVLDTTALRMWMQLCMG